MDGEYTFEQDAQDPSIYIVKKASRVVAGCKMPVDPRQACSIFYFNSQESFDELCKNASEYFPEGRLLINEQTMIKASCDPKETFCTISRDSVYLNPAPMEKIAASLSKEEEFEEWKKYKNNNDRQALNSLVRSFKPMIQSRIQPWLKNSPLPKSAVEAEGMRLFKMGVDSYNPDKGAALNTHVWNYLSKIHRYGYTYQNVGSLPEPRAAKVGTYQNAYEQLKDRTNRDPTIKELQEELGWKASDLKAIQEEIRSDLSLDQELGPVFANNTDPATEALMATYFDADQEKKLIMEYTFDEFKAKPTLGNVKTIAKKVGATVNKVRSQHRDIYKSIKSILDSAGPLSLDLHGASRAYDMAN